jgi:hypothetical protein
MPELQWGTPGTRRYETGVSKGVLYPRASDGDYDAGGVAWSGLTTVTESPSGAEASPTYADNIKYLNMVGPEEFGFTIEAVTYPDEFERCDGSAEVRPGVFLGQQNRETFGFSYQTLIGSDTAGNNAGHKTHLVYGALAAPSEKARTTVNDSPEPAGMSWECTTTPTSVGTVDGVEYLPTAHIVLDSTKVDADDLAAVEAILYGRGAGNTVARLPLPAEVFTLVPAAAVGP